MTAHSCGRRPGHAAALRRQILALGAALMVGLLASPAIGQRQPETVGYGVEGVGRSGHVGHLVPDPVVGQSLQLPGCAVRDRSVLAHVDRADGRRDHFLLGPAQRAIRHGTP